MTAKGHEESLGGGSEGCSEPDVAAVACLESFLRLTKPFI